MNNKQHLKNAEARKKQLTIVGTNHKDGEYLVLNPKTGKMYDVSVENDKVFSCTCEHHIFRKTVCKHMVFVADCFGYDIDDLLTSIY